MADEITNILIIGYGNPGRLDDGLGPALAAEFEKMALKGVTVDSDYQLTVEDASAIAKHEIVIFVDASVSGDEPFYFERLKSSESPMSFSSHSVEPGAVVALAQELFGSLAKAYVLGIRGYEFNEFGEKLSEKAKENLKKAVDFLVDVIKNNKFE